MVTKETLKHREPYSYFPHTHRMREKQTKQERLGDRQKIQLKEWWEFYSSEDLKNGNSDFSCTKRKKQK